MQGRSNKQTNKQIGVGLVRWTRLVETLALQEYAGQIKTGLLVVPVSEKITLKVT